MTSILERESPVAAGRSAGAAGSAARPDQTGKVPSAAQAAGPGSSARESANAQESASQESDSTAGLTGPAGPEGPQPHPVVRFTELLSGALDRLGPVAA